MTPSDEIHNTNTNPRGPFYRTDVRRADIKNWGGHITRPRVAIAVRAWR